MSTYEKIYNTNRAYNKNHKVHKGKVVIKYFIREWVLMDYFIRQGRLIKKFIRQTGLIKCLMILDPYKVPYKIFYKGS